MGPVSDAALPERSGAAKKPRRKKGEKKAGPGEKNG
jgi:hypothetical protein